MGDQENVAALMRRISKDVTGEVKYPIDTNLMEREASENAFLSIQKDLIADELALQ